MSSTIWGFREVRARYGVGMSQNPPDDPYTIPASNYPPVDYPPVDYPSAGYPPGGYSESAYGTVVPMPPQAYAGGDPMAPWGRDPYSGQPLSDKSKVAAGLLQIFLGVFGAGRFYTGHTQTAIIMLSLTVVGFALSLVFVGFFVLAGVNIWALVDGIMLLSGRQTDSRGLLLRS